MASNDGDGFGKDGGNQALEMTSLKNHDDDDKDGLLRTEEKNKNGHTVIAFNLTMASICTCSMMEMTARACGGAGNSNISGSGWRRRSSSPRARC